jgi:hypothetical protein
MAACLVFPDAGGAQMAGRTVPKNECPPSAIEVRLDERVCKRDCGKATRPGVVQRACCKERDGQEVFCRSWPRCAGLECSVW